jgi:ribonuclease E
MKRMLINATHAEELRIALVDGQQLYDLDIENRAREQKKANIYKARITRVEASLEAAFVEFGANRHGFLPLKEISREYFKSGPSKGGRINIKDVVKEGMELVVQVDKEERGNKGAALTTFVSLAGRYLVLMPNNPRAGGVSRRIEGEEREELKLALSKLDIPANMGVIVRTAGLGRGAEELQWDLNYLIQLSDAITKAATENKSPTLIYQESDVVIRAIRDNLREDIGEILIDTEESFERAKQFIEQVMPQYLSRVKLYDDSVPLFNRYQIEGQIESAFQRDVRLPSGGSIVIDPTEALVSIDINSARATRGSDIEATALQTNLEAADEVARQLRLRDMGGLVVIDFIDMSTGKNQRAVENRIRQALQVDRARVQVGRISRFGLLEMSRQRLRPSLGETSGVVCPRCNGLGFIRDIESLALSIMRLMEEEALKESSAQIRAIVPLTIAAYLLNEKRSVLSEIEERNKVKLVIVPSADMDTPHYQVDRIRTQDEGDNTEASYEIIVDTPEPESTPAAKDQTIQQAAVKTVAPTTPPPRASSAEKKGFLGKIFGDLFSPGKTIETKPKAKGKKPVARDAAADNRGTAGRRQRDNRPGQQERSRNEPRKNARQQDAQKKDVQKKDVQKKDAQKKDVQKKDEPRRSSSARQDKQQRSRQEAKPDTRTSSRGSDSRANKDSGKGNEAKEKTRTEKSQQGESASTDKRNQGNRQKNQQRRRNPERQVEQDQTADTAIAAAKTQDNAVIPAEELKSDQQSEQALPPNAGDSTKTLTEEVTPVAVTATPTGSDVDAEKEKKVNKRKPSRGRAANDPRNQKSEAALDETSDVKSLPDAEPGQIVDQAAFQLESSASSESIDNPTVPDTDLEATTRQGDTAIDSPPESVEPDIAQQQPENQKSDLDSSTSTEVATDNSDESAIDSAEDVLEPGSDSDAKSNAVDTDSSSEEHETIPPVSAGIEIPQDSAASVAPEPVQPDEPARKLSARVRAANDPRNKHDLPGAASNKQADATEQTSEEKALKDDPGTGFSVDTASISEPDSDVSKDVKQDL